MWSWRRRNQEVKHTSGVPCAAICQSIAPNVSNDYTGAVLVLACRFRHVVKREMRVHSGQVHAAPATVDRRIAQAMQVVFNTTVPLAWEGNAILPGSPDTGHDRWNLGIDAIQSILIFRIVAPAGKLARRSFRQIVFHANLFSNFFVRCCTPVHACRFAVDVFRRCCTNDQRIFSGRVIESGDRYCRAVAAKSNRCATAHYRYYQ